VDIRCARCRRTYFVPDEVVHGRVLRARCSLCGNAFSVEVARRRRKGDAAGGVPSSSASAIPDVLDGLEDQLGWLDEAAREAAEQETVLLTVQRSRRSSAALLVGAAALLLAGAGGVGAWIALRPRPQPPAPRAPVAREAAVAPVSDVGALAGQPPEQAASVAAAAPAPGPAPARRATVERTEAPRLDRRERHLLDLLARKNDVAVVPVGEEEGAAASARSALDPAVAAKVIAAQRKAFDACVSRALRQRPDLKLARRATLVLTIEPSGAVQRAYLAEEDVDRSEVGACIAETARRMVFPAFDGEPVDVATPLSLSAVF
jgi:transposase-like protein